MTDSAADFYVTGGTLRYDAPSYVERLADRELFDALIRGEFCYVLTSRQMGKSSLMVRTTVRLREHGVRVVALDLTALGQNLTAEQWYEGLLGELGQQLDLERELDEFWLSQERRGPLQRWMRALREVVLPHCPNRLVIFVDEIDAVRSLPFSTDELFAAIRECYNRRTRDLAFQDLTFCLLGVATPSDLIQDSRTTPFNIGHRVELNDFTEAEAAPLARGLGRGEKLGKALLRRILDWTGGHPYLTQRLCRAVAVDPRVDGPGSVDRLCEELFLSHRAREKDDNLLFVRERLLRQDADPAAVLDLYSDIRRGKRMRDDDTSRLVGILRLSGIARVVDGHLCVRNRIYARVFDREWITTQMPDAELRRQRAAYRRGLLRAASVAAAVVAVMAGLALTAVSYAQRAQTASAQLNQKATSLQAALSQLQRANEQLQAAVWRENSQRQRADHEAEHARAAGRKERTQRVRAEVARWKAEQERRRAEQQQRIAGLERAQALSERRMAVQQQRIAQEQREESRRRLVALNVANGTRLVDEGDLFGSLPWFAQALTLDRGHPPQEEADRVRLAVVLQQCPKLVQVWFHERPIWDARFSPDGRRVVTASGDRTARVWNADTGAPIATLRPGDRVAQASFSPDGRRVLTASGKIAQVWDAATGRTLGPPLKHAQWLRDAAFSPDGRRVVTASGGGMSVPGDGQVQVWDAETGRTLTPPLGNGTLAMHAVFSPDGSRVATGNADGTVRVWDAKTGRPVTPPMQHQGYGYHVVQDVEFSPDGHRVASASNDFTVQVWDAATGRPLFPPLKHKSGVNRAVFSPDGRRIVTAGWDGTARVWNAETGRPVSAPMKHTDAVRDAAFSPDGSRVVTASGDKTVRVWDAETGEPLTPPLKHGGPVTRAAFSPDGRRVLTAGQDRMARIWDLATVQQVRQAAKQSPGFHHAVISADGRRVLTYGNDGMARIWDTATGEPVTPPLRHHAAVWHMALSPDGRRVATASFDKTAQLWDAATGRPLTPPLSHRDYVVHVAFSPDSRRVATGSNDHTARVWDAASGQPVTPPMKHSDCLCTVEFSPDGRRVLTSSIDRTARLWDAATGRQIGPSLAHGTGVQSASFSPDGRRVITLAFDGIARVWNAATGKLIRPLLRRETQVDSLALSRDSRRVVTTNGQTARVWDAVTGEPISPPLPHGGHVTRAAFSRDGRWVVTASGSSTTSGGEARVWDAATGEPITPPLKQPNGVFEAMFGPDGRGVLTVGGDPRVRLWRLTRDARQAHDLPALVQLLSSHGIDDTYGFVPIESTTLRTAWRTLRPKYRDDFAASPAQVLAWHEREAEALERSRQWRAAVPHLEQLIAAKPASWGLYLRRGEAHAELSQWDQAAADFARAIGSGAEDPRVWFDQALLQLRAGDLAGYRATCAQVLARFQANHTAIEANVLGMTCALHVDAIPDAARLLPLAEKNVADWPKGYAPPQELRNTLGAMLFRAGRFEEALQRLNEAAGLQSEYFDGRVGRGGAVYNGLFLAMCHQRLGHAAEARQSLADAARWIDAAREQNPDDPDGAPLPWAQRLELQFLRREAEALINGRHP